MARDRAAGHERARHLHRLRARPALRPGRDLRLPEHEPVEEFECSLDGGPWEGCDAVYELIGLASGEHTLRVRAIDICRDPERRPDARPATPGPCSASRRRRSSRIPPELSGSKSATFTFTSDQPNATFQCSVDGSAFTPCTSPFIAGPLIQDAHTFEVYALNQFPYLDGEQVLDQTPAEFEWEVQDVEPPDTEITNVTRLGFLDLVEPNSLRFEFAGTDNGTAWFELEFECPLDGGPWEGCDTPFHYVPLEELPGGEHVLRVRAVDDFDNVDPTPAEHRFTTEAEPETTIVDRPGARDRQHEATFTFSSDHAGATFECSLDAGAVHRLHLRRDVHERALRRARAARSGRGARAAPSTRRRPS